MKNINFSIGGGFLYQWWIGVFIKYTIENYGTNDESYTKTYSKNLKEVISSTFTNDNFFSDKYGYLDTDNIDILLEGKRGCFEDINLLSKEAGDETKILFFQVKGGGEGIKRGVLYGKSKRTHLFSNFLNNQNIYNISKKSKFIIISNKHVDKNVIAISKGDDRVLVVNKIISEIRSKYKIRVTGRSIKKLERLINDVYDGVVVKRRMYGTTLPFKNADEQEKIILFVKNTINIMQSTVILENFNLNTIINKLYKELGEEKADVIFKDIYQKSTDVTSIKNIDINFSRYLKYNDVFFLSNEEVSKINEIREGKFL